MSPTIISCQCGAKVSLSNAAAGQAYRCPRCKQPIQVPAAPPKPAPGKPVSRQPMPTHAKGGMVSQGGQIHPNQAAYGAGVAQAKPIGAPYPHHAPPASSSDGGGLGMAGFVLSIVSFFIWVLAPIAFLVSIFGLRSKNGHGYAIAGAIISAFQSIGVIAMVVMIFCFGFLGLFVAKETIEFGMDMAEQLETSIYVEQTREELVKAAEAIDEQTVSSGELPDEELANELIKHNRDAWGNPLRFEVDKTDRPSYSLMSNGPDAEPDTNDDVGESFPVCIASTLADATQLVQGDSTYQVSAGLNWLESNHPATDETLDRARRPIVNAMVRLFADPNHSAQAQHVFELWGGDEQRTLFAELLDDNHDVNVQSVVEQLINESELDLALQLMNHPDYMVRTNVEKLFLDEQFDDVEILRISISDLSSSERSRYALERILEFDLDDLPDDQFEPSDIAEGILNGLDEETIGRPQFDEALEFVLENYEGDPSLTLIRIHADHPYPELLDALAELQSGEAIDFFSSNVGKPGRVSSDARRVLIAMGPIAEMAVIGGLDPSNRTRAIAAIQILAEIGTERSIPELEALLDDASLKSVAQNAIDSISQANRAPIEPPAR